MTVKRNLESKIETAFIKTLKLNRDFGAVPIRGWQDGSNGKTYPIVLVNCEVASNETVDQTRQGDLYRVNVDIATMTYSADDRNKSVVQNLLGMTRDTLASKSLLTTLKSKTTNIAFLGVIAGNSQSQFDENNTNIMMLTLDVRIQYINL